jgi:rhodanese-related sulfurtransferase
MGIKEIDPVTLKQWISEGKAILVDVREPAEVAREAILEAHSMPLSRFNPAELPAHDDKIVVYFCASGGRTSMYGPSLHAATPGASEVYHLSGGIGAWKNAGHAVS